MCNHVRSTYERHHMTLFNHDLFRQFAIGFAIGGVAVAISNPGVFASIGALIA